MPYTIIVYPLVFLIMPRLWSVAKVHGYVTTADFVRGRFGNRVSIAASNLYTRNIYREFLRPNLSSRNESQTAKTASLIVKFGALVFILFLPTQYAIQLQLLGGIWITQTLPAVFIVLYTRRLDSWALLVGWAVGIVSGTWMAASLGFQSSVYPVTFGGFTIPAYATLWALALNIILSVALTPALRGLSTLQRTDATTTADYL